MKLRLILTIAVSSFFFTVKAQKPTDFELWTGASFKLKLNKKFKVDIEQQARFNDTISALKKTFTELGLKYQMNKSIAFKVNYRFVIRPTKSNQNRISVDAYYHWDKKKFPLSFDYRLRFQDTENVNSGKNFTYLRNKLSVKYNLSKLVDPTIAYEIFYRFNGKTEFRVTRLTIGFDWRLNKKMNLNTFYRLQNDININTPEKQHIVGVSFSYSLGLKKILKKRAKKKAQKR